MLNLVFGNTISIVNATATLVHPPDVDPIASNTDRNQARGLVVVIIFNRSQCALRCDSGDVATIARRRIIGLALYHRRKRARPIVLADRDMRARNHRVPETERPQENSKLGAQNS